MMYFPIYKWKKDPENYGRVKLMLHHPFRVVEDLKQRDYPDEEPWATFAEAYEHCRHNHTHENDAYGDDIPEPEPEFEDEEVVEDEIRNSWEDLARRGPRNQDRDLVGTPDAEQLGHRPVDRLYDW